MERTWEEASSLRHAFRTRITRCYSVEAGAPQLLVEILLEQQLALLCPLWVMLLVEVMGKLLQTVSSSWPPPKVATLSACVWLLSAVV